MESPRRLIIAALVLCCAAMVTANQPQGIAEHDLDVSAPALASPLDTATTFQVRLEVHNRGQSAWTADRGDALAYHWLSSDGEMVVWDGVRTPFVDPVEPGMSAIVEATVGTPELPGDYLLQWDVVREDVLWLSEVDPTPVEPQSALVVATHDFGFLRVRTPRVMVVDGERVARIVLRNDGSRPWSGDGSVLVAYHWFSDDGEVVLWEGRRTAVDRLVGPGETIELDVVVSAPPVTGRVLLQWDMVEEGVCWFSQRRAEPEPLVAVFVLPPVGINPGTWVLVVLFVAAAALWAAHGEHSPMVLRFWATADVMWCVAAMVIKQHWVLASAGLSFAFSGWGLSCAGAAVIGLVLLALPSRLRPWVAWGVTAVVTAILFGDLIHERFFGDLGSVAALRSVGQIAWVEASVRSLVSVGDFWFWADLPIGLVLVWVVSRRLDIDKSRRRLAAVLAGLVGVVGIIGAVALSSEQTSLRQVFHTTQLARSIGVLNLHTVDLGRTVVGVVFRSGLTDREIASTVGFFDERRSLRAGSGRFFGVAEGHNLIMVQVESLQAFVVGLRIGGREVTPFLNSFAVENLWFGNVTDQTEEGRSSDAELATQTSLLPPDRGAAAFLYSGNEFTGLASILDGHGYSTLSAVPFEGSFWNRRNTHRAYGFEHRLFVDEFESGEVIGWGLNDRDFLTQAVDRLTDLPQPWCGYLLTLSLHHPFEGFPEAGKVLDVGEWEGTPFGNYVHTMHYFDRALESFVAALDGEGRLEDTVIALWGDHDAGFPWEPEIASVVGTTPDARGWYLSQRVPLVVRVPGVTGSGSPITVPAGHIDVAPTLLALLGVDPAPYAFMGRNLLGAPGPGPVIGEYRCWRDATHLYLRGGPSLADGECIELATMKQVSYEACAAGFEGAHRQVEISTRVLEHDLQRKVHVSLLEQP